MSGVPCRLRRRHVKRRITEKDIYDFRWIAGAQFAPDGSRGGLHARQGGGEARQLRHGAVDGPAAGGARGKITAGPRDSDALVPDGKTVAFVRAGERPQIWLLPMEGGEARQLTDIPRRVGLRVVAERPLDRVHVDHARFGHRQEERRGGAERRPRDHQGRLPEQWLRVRRAGPAELHLGGRRARGGRRSPKGAPVDDRRVQRGDIVWSKDGSKITSRRTALRSCTTGADNDVYAVNASGGEP